MEIVQYALIALERLLHAVAVVGVEIDVQYPPGVALQQVMIANTGSLK